MDFVVRLLGAAVVTYFVSRATLALSATAIRSGLSRVIVAHVASMTAIALFVGLLRAYWGTFEWQAVIPYVGPQLLWFMIDYFRSVRR